jgi:hypothetical protein
MIKALLKWLFKKEYAEALNLIRQAKNASFNRYIKIDPFDMKDEGFIIPILQIVNTKEFIFWLVERKGQYENLIKYGTPANRENNIGRAMAIDELLGDCENFKVRHLENVNRQKEVSNVTEI